MMGGYGMTGGFGWVFMLLWWVLIVVGIAVLVKWVLTSSDGEASGGAARKARDILDERYARGEIDDEEYQKRRRSLSQ